MNNLEYVNTLAPVVGNSFGSLATLELLHMETTALLKVAAKKKRKKEEENLDFTIQISIPSP